MVNDSVSRHVPIEPVSMPRIAVVMPAYNASRFIGDSISSILAQSFRDFELIVCDDCSTDDTVDIIKTFEDSRIRLISTSRNTGSAKFPRELAIEAARAPLICWIDADDTVEPDYLQKMILRMDATGANLVCSRMVALRESVEQYILPPAGFDLLQVMTGRDAVMLSLGCPWQINFNGWLCERRLWTSISTFKSLTVNHMDADDFSAREIVYNAPIVAFADAEYYYRLHPDAITKRIGLKKFESVITDRLVLEYFREKGFREGEEAMCRSLCQRMISLMRLWCIHHRHMNGDDAKKAKRLLRHYFNRISAAELRDATVSFTQRLLLNLPFFISVKIISIVNY